MEVDLNMDNHSIISLPDPKPSDSFYAANVNYVNKTISDNNAVINTNIENKIKESEEYCNSCIKPSQKCL